MTCYVCRLCSDWDDTCTACVPNMTPDIFDKTIMDVFCKHNKKPFWMKNNVVREIRLIGGKI